MLFKAYREQVYHSQREGLSVGQSSSSMSDRTVRPVVERVAKSHDGTGQPGQELNTEHAQIRTLFGPTEGAKSSPTVRREIRRHKFHADYVRRSIQKLIETLSSLKEEKFIVLIKQTNNIDEINNLFMNSY